MGKVILYRYTAANDTTSTAEKIEFDTTINVNEAGAIIDKDGGGVKVVPVEAVGENQGAEMEFGDKQALSTFEKIYIINAVVFQMKPSGGGANTILDTLDKWEKGAKTSLGIFDQGRFGIVIEADTTKNFLPVATTKPGPQGLMWIDIAYTLDFEHNQEKFTLRLTVSKGNGT
jgi:hypothetical protein